MEGEEVGMAWGDYTYWKGGKVCGHVRVCEFTALMHSLQ